MLCNFSCSCSAYFIMCNHLYLLNSNTHHVCLLVYRCIWLLFVFFKIRIHNIFVDYQKKTKGSRKRKKGDRYEYDYPDLPSYGFVTLSLLKFTKTFLTKSFFPNLPLLCNRHFMHLPYGHTAANSFSESENASLKRSSLGPKPNDSLDRSGIGNVRSSSKRFNNI